MSYVFEPPRQASVAINDSDERFPVRRIFCVGQNYAAHAREMGGDPDRNPPFFFCKPADAVVENGATIPFPSQTDNLHHEIEMVVALKAGGVNISVEDARDMIFGYAVGLDLTRRDLQKTAKDKGRPWDAAKAFDNAAPISAITPKEKADLSPDSPIKLSVNGELRQQGLISDLIWSVDEIISTLSTLFELKAGDLIFTGTPSGVGPLRPGDTIEGSVGGVGTITTRLEE